jgi:hypothetical protein
MAVTVADRAEKPTMFVVKWGFMNGGLGGGVWARGVGFHSGEIDGFRVPRVLVGWQNTVHKSEGAIYALQLALLTSSITIAEYASGGRHDPCTLFPSSYKPQRLHQAHSGLRHARCASGIARLYTYICQTTWTGIGAYQKTLGYATSQPTSPPST